jgi:DNA-binding FrmR family transcriptional regulator
MASAGYRRPRRNAPGAWCKLRYPEPPLFGIFGIWPPRLGSKLRFDTLRLWRSQLKMSHTSREKLDLVNRTKRIVGQLESVLRGLNEDAHCADVLQRLAAARGAINSIMAELIEDHIHNHMPRNSKSSEEAAEDVIEIVKSYLK